MYLSFLDFEFDFLYLLLFLSNLPELGSFSFCTRHSECLRKRFLYAQPFRFCWRFFGYFRLGGVRGALFCACLLLLSSPLAGTGGTQRKDRKRKTWVLCRTCNILSVLKLYGGSGVKVEKGADEIS